MSLKDLTPTQRELAQFISQLSERSYRAGWMSGIEVEVWRAMHTPDLGGVTLGLTASEVERLADLSVRCGGWIVFDDVSEETFVPMSDWIRVYAKATAI